MRILFIIGCALLSMAAVAQPYAEFPRRTFDFSGIDPASINAQKLDRQWDSLYRAMKLDSIRQLIQYKYANEYSADYAAFAIGLFGQGASLKGINAGLRAAGMETINDQFAVLPLGLCVRTERLHISYLGHILFRNKSEDATRKLDVRGFSFEMGLGYDIVNTKRFQLYPHASLAYQTFHVKAVDLQAPSNINTLDQLFSQGGNTSLSKRSLLLNYGMEADFFLTQDKSGGGVILGLAYGLSTPLVDGNFKLEREKASLSIHSDQLKASYFGVIVKFAVKN